MINRRSFLKAGSALAAFPFALGGFSGTSLAQDGAITDQDRILGDPEAPITIIEYASLTCPHCANFHATAYKDLKKNWIDTGKVRFVYRHMPLDQLATVGSVAAESLDDDNRFFGLITYLFQTQDTWARSQNPLEEMKKIALLAGVSNEQFDAALKDRELIDRVINQAREGAAVFNVNSTPSFVINDKLYNNMSYEDFNEVLEDLS